MEWQPIDTLPDKRGSLLIYDTERKCIFAAYYDPSDGLGLSEWEAPLETLQHRATHWMPMPEPPA